MCSVRFGPSSQRIYNQNTVRDTHFNQIRRKNTLQSISRTEPTIDCTIDKEWNTPLHKVLLRWYLAHHNPG